MPDSNVSMFFFFQAEDGIRDLTVTGVQTCALPIYCRKTLDAQVSTSSVSGRSSTWLATSRWAAPRSEEHTSELQSQSNLVCRLLLEKKNSRATAGAGSAEHGTRSAMGAATYTPSRG